MLITLPASPQDDLQWASEIEAARGSEGPLNWHLDFGLFDRLTQSLADQGQLNTLALAADHFTQQIFPEFKKRTEQILLYNGTTNLADALLRLPAADVMLESWLAERCPEEITSEKDEKYAQQLFARDMLLDLLHFLSSRLPESHSATVRFETLSFDSLFHQLFYFSAHAFDSLNVVIDSQLESFQGLFGEAREELPTGVLMPDEGCVTPQQWGRLPEIVESLEHPYRVIPEALLTEQWAGLDQLVIDPDVVSSMGQRKVAGFEAAGGEVKKGGEMGCNSK